jgi:hypothetical protein
MGAASQRMEIRSSINSDEITIPEEEIMYVIDKCLKLKIPIADIPKIVDMYQLTSMNPSSIPILAILFKDIDQTITREEKFDMVIKTYHDRPQ